MANVFILADCGAISGVHFLDGREVPIVSCRYEPIFTGTWFTQESNS